MSLPQFEEDDILAIDEWGTYRIKMVDPMARNPDLVSQYRLEPFSGPPARLLVKHDEGEFGFIPVIGMSPGDVDVVEEEEDDGV